MNRTSPANEKSTHSTSTLKEGFLYASIVIAFTAGPFLIPGISIRMGVIILFATPVVAFTVLLTIAIWKNLSESTHHT